LPQRRAPVRSACESHVCMHRVAVRRECGVHDAGATVGPAIRCVPNANARVIAATGRSAGVQTRTAGDSCRGRRSARGAIHTSHREQSRTSRGLAMVVRWPASGLQWPLRGLGCAAAPFGDRQQAPTAHASAVPVADGWLCIALPSGAVTARELGVRIGRQQVHTVGAGERPGRCRVQRPSITRWRGRRAGARRETAWELYRSLSDVDGHQGLARGPFIYVALRETARGNPEEVAGRVHVLFPVRSRAHAPRTAGRRLDHVGGLTRRDTLQPLTHPAGAGVAYVVRK
jgi:hypothetical protein